MRKIFFFLQIAAFVTFNFFLLLTVYQVLAPGSQTVRIGYKTPAYNNREEYDATLQRLNSMEKLTDYCDSLYENVAFHSTDIRYESAYAELASSVVRKRFYHGYSEYGMNNNFMATFLSSAISMNGLNAVVIPNDILKFPYAACSQQSIVLMELFRHKGFKTRKVGFKGKKYGHFCFEVFYYGTWHFFDPDMEPEVSILEKYNRPSIAFLAKNRDILLGAYGKYSKEMVLDIFPNYFYGKPDVFPASRAIIFQKITKFLSYTIWTFFLFLFIVIRKRYRYYCSAAFRTKTGKPGFSGQHSIPSGVYSPA